MHNFGIWPFDRNPSEMSMAQLWLLLESQKTEKEMDFSTLEWEETKEAVIKSRMDRLGLTEEEESE
jgi:hypothetical protein